MDITKNRIAGRKPGNRSLRPGISVEENIEQCVQALFHDNCRKIQHQIDKRQDKEAAGEHGTENAEAVKRHIAHHRHG